MGDYPFNDNLSSCTNLFSKWKEGIDNPKSSWESNPLKWVRLESFPKSPTITQIYETNTNNHDDIEFHPQKHTHKEWVSCSCNEEWRKEWTFPIHGHHNGSKLSYSLKLANNKKRNTYPLGLYICCIKVVRERGGKWSLTITKKTTWIIIIHVYYWHDWYARIIKVVKKPKFLLFALTC